jgi:hypothetical protein
MIREHAEKMIPAMRAASESLQNMSRVAAAIGYLGTTPEQQAAETIGNGLSKLLAMLADREEAEQNRRASLKSNAEPRRGCGFDSTYG